MAIDEVQVSGGHRFQADGTPYAKASHIHHSTSKV